MHARITRGALYSYNIFDGDRVVGFKSVRIDKKFSPWKETATYGLIDDEKTFDNAADFKAAYEALWTAQQRDREWEAAAPQKGIESE